MTMQKPMINYGQKRCSACSARLADIKKAVEEFPGVLDQVWNSGIEVCCCC